MDLRVFLLSLFVAAGGALAHQCPPSSGQSLQPPTLSNEPCIFPFTFEGKIYHDCMTVHGWRDTRLECPVNTCDANDERVRWAVCKTSRKRAMRKGRKLTAADHCRLHSNSSAGFCDCDFRRSFCHWEDTNSSGARFVRRPVAGLFPSHAAQLDVNKPLKSLDFVAMAKGSSLRFYRPVELQSPVFPAPTESTCRLEAVYRTFRLASQSSPCVSVFVTTGNGSESPPVFRDCSVSSKRWQVVSAPIGARGSDSRVVLSVHAPTFVANAARDVASLVVSKLAFRGCTRVDRPPALDCHFDRPSASPPSGFLETRERPSWHEVTSVCGAWRNAASNRPGAAWRVAKAQERQLWYGGLSVGAEGDAGYLYVDAASATDDKDQRPVMLETTEELAAHKEVACLHFHYHLFGADVRRLELHHIDVASSAKTRLWSRSGSQGREWRRASVTLAKGRPYRLVFEAFVPRRRPDVHMPLIGRQLPPPEMSIGLDRLSATWGACRVEEQECDFERGSVCRRVANVPASLQWRVVSAEKALIWTHGAPPADATTNAPSGHYLMAVNNRRILAPTTAEARFRSVDVTDPAGACLQGFYFAHAARLEVALTSEPKRPLFSRPVHNSASWRLLQVDIPQQHAGTQDAVIRFTAVRPGGLAALDDLRLRSGRCPPPHTACTFDGVDAQYCAFQPRLHITGCRWRHARSLSRDARMHDAAAPSAGGYMDVECSLAEPVNAPRIAGHATHERYTALEGPRVPALHRVAVQLKYHVTGTARLLVGVEAPGSWKPLVSSVVSKPHTDGFASTCHEMEAARDGVVVVWAATPAHDWYSRVAVDDIVLRQSCPNQLRTARTTALPTTNTTYTAATTSEKDGDSARAHDGEKLSGLGEAGIIGMVVAVILIVAAVIGVACLLVRRRQSPRGLFSTRRLEKEVVIENPAFTVYDPTQYTNHYPTMME